jgi:glycolate oxidase iron-sulfur subunit
MQTQLAAFIRDTPEGREADAILRKCVHCGFCNATCPTYQLLGDELDGPRGRIYLMKEVLEGAAPTGKTLLHLDRCLTCRACDTTCPSGVEYGRLVDIGRPIVEERVARGALESAWRRALIAVIPRRALFEPLLRLGQLMRSLLPAGLQRKVPRRGPAAGPWPTAVHPRKMLVLEGCVQPALSPNTNAAAARVLDRLGITLVRERAGCCGAVPFHLNAHDDARTHMRRNIDAWWPLIEQGAEAIVITASGCGVMVRDYAHALAGDPAYAAKAKRVSALAKDISEVVVAEKERLLNRQPPAASRQRIAFHPPCTLQHGLKIRGKVESLLADLGYELTPVPDAHLCCGSAGTYSILQPELSRQLQANKIAALTSGRPAAILTANIGCQAHLQGVTELPVRHWIEELDHILPRPGLH